jgi:hypothetical protein
MTRAILLAVLSLSLLPVSALAQGAAQPAATAFDRLKALEGEWVDAEGAFGPKGAVAVTYKVTSGGNSVVEVFPVGSPGEMVTVYHKDGGDIVLTHYCSAGNQPRMRAKSISEDVMMFEFDGGMNIDPKVTSHMHEMKMEFLGPDEIRATWQNWSKGGPDSDRGVFKVTRKK